jgi:radical SAM-linked protein
VNASYLESIFARGDRRLGRVLHEAHRQGCRFDGWHEHFDFSAWMQAFATTGLDPDWYALRVREQDEHLPWDHLDSGVKREFLWQERRRALQAEESPSCTPHCRRCGVCNDEITVLRTPEYADNAADAETPAERGVAPREKAFRLRVVYSKTGLLRFLSHLDLNRAFQRAVARIHAPVAFSQGYNPHPLLAFGPALPVGVEGRNELLDIFFSEPIEPEQFVDAMNATLPEGIAMHQASILDLQAPSLSAALTHFVYQVTLPSAFVAQPGYSAAEAYSAAELTHKVEAFHSQETYWVIPFKKRTDGLDIKPFITNFDIHPDGANAPRIHLVLQTLQGMTLKPEDVLRTVLHISSEQILDCRIVRIECSYE